MIKLNQMKKKLQLKLDEAQSRNIFKIIFDIKDNLYLLDNNVVDEDIVNSFIKELTIKGANNIKTYNNRIEIHNVVFDNLSEENLRLLIELLEE